VGAKREETREMPRFYTGREKRKGKLKGGKRPAALPLMAGRQSGAKEQEVREKRQETEGDLIAGSYCHNWIA
jgi:hypothetical protein